MPPGSPPTPPSSPVFPSISSAMPPVNAPPNPAFPPVSPAMPPPGPAFPHGSSAMPPISSPPNSGVSPPTRLFLTHRIHLCRRIPALAASCRAAAHCQCALRLRWPHVRLVRLTTPSSMPAMSGPPAGASPTGAPFGVPTGPAVSPKPVAVPATTPRPVGAVPQPRPTVTSSPVIEAQPALVASVERERAPSFASAQPASIIKPVNSPIAVGPRFEPGSSISGARPEMDEPGSKRGGQRSN